MRIGVGPSGRERCRIQIREITKQAESIVPFCASTVTHMVDFSLYAKSGSIGDARVVFDSMTTRDVITWYIMIGAYAESVCAVEAYRLFLQIEREGFRPDGFTYASILNASVSAGALEWVKEVHSDALKAGLESDLRVGNALVHMYAKSGSIDDARVVFDRMEKRDVITWTVIIGAYSESGCNVELGELAAEELLKLKTKDAGAYVLLSNVYAAGEKWEKVSLVHILMEESAIRNEAGRSWIEVDNKIHYFVVRDTSHPEATAIYTELKKLTEI